MDYRHTANPRLGCPKDGSNGRQVKSNINLRLEQEAYDDRMSNIRVSQDQCVDDDMEDQLSNHQIEQQYTERTVALEEYPEDNEVNEDIINSFPNKLFSKVLAVYAQSYCLFRTPVLEKLSNGIIVSRRTKLTKGNLFLIKE